MSSFKQKIRGTSIPVKIFVGAFFTSVLLIFLVVGFLRGAIHEAFESQLNSLLEERAFQHRVRFSRSVEAYHHAVRLLSMQQSLIDHLVQHRDDDTEHNHFSKGRPPVWLPNLSLMRSFLAPHYVLLFDPKGRLIDLYQNWPISPPVELKNIVDPALSLSVGQTYIEMFGTMPFVLASEQVRDDGGELLGTLMLSTPLDESFMVAANGPATDWNMVALIDDKSGRVLSSNSGQRIPTGRKVEALKAGHLFNEPQFLALGGMELSFRFASLVSKDSLEILSDGIMEKEWATQLAQAVVYVGPFIVIIIWLTRRILRLTAKVEAFSKHDLGYNQMSLPEFHGDQIDVLEQRFQQLTDDIRKRTSQLETANHELEAFAYSVSHDLRAPLRSIDGFSQALDEDYHDRLDEVGHDYLRRVRKAAQRMGNLIDEMLMLSRVSRCGMKMSRVNLSKIAEDVVADLSQAHPDRDVDIRITGGMSTFGDEGLLRVAIANLLDNAWKFTLKTEKPVIEFGTRTLSYGVVLPGTKSEVFFVADNGAGFDMEFVNKLFGAFQRLHRDTDFPGTGVGLATVQRIISRHKGRIWAEGEPGKGATFFFCLSEV